MFFWKVAEMFEVLWIMGSSCFSDFDNGMRLVWGRCDRLGVIVFYSFVMKLMFLIIN